MFSPKTVGTPRSQSQFSPFSAQKGTFSNTSKRRSNAFFTPQKRSSFVSSRNQSLNRSLQTSQLVEETAQHRLEIFGTALPVLVTEALHLSERNQENEVQLDPTGWARLIFGRKLLLWKYKPTKFAKSSQCRELALPSTHLTHKACLVTLLPPPGEQQSMACVAVSPEGAIRYWSNVSHEGSYVEISADLNGEEAHSIISLPNFSCILTTTTSAMYLLIPSVGQNLLKVKALRPPSGMLKGIGRRMSSLFFGSATPQPAGTEMHQILPGEEMEDGSQAFYALTGNVLQKWGIVGESEELLFQCEVDRIMREDIANEVWSQPASSLPNLKTWLIDMKETRDGVVILGAGVNTDVSDVVKYVIGTLHTEGRDPPQSFLSFAVSMFTTTYEEGDEELVTCYKLLLPDPNSPGAYLYNKKTVICTSVSSSNDPVDKVEFTQPGDKLLGAGYCDDVALFFSNTHGLVSMKTVMQGMDQSLSIHESLLGSKLETTIGNATPSKLEEMSMSEDKVARLKAAFLYSCKGKQDEAAMIVEEMFPSSVSVSGLSGQNTTDVLIAQLSEDLVDDFPASDPRWAESVPHDTGSSSTSLIIQHQLEDKLKAHDIFITFLRNLAIWDRLTNIEVRKCLMSTKHLLCEHAEKVVAALALRTLHSQHSQLIDACIKRVLEMRGETGSRSSLTPQDIFYREVSKVQDIVEVLLEGENLKLGTNTDPKDLVAIVINVNQILVKMVIEAISYRKSNAMKYQETQSSNVECQYIAWTSSTGQRGMRKLITKQHTLIVDHALPSAGDAQERGMLFQQLLELTDIILDGYKDQLESIRQIVGETQQYNELNKEYEQMRSQLISPLMKVGQYERAASLAEKYCDYGILVQMCEETDNQERLQKYMNQFQNRNFADFVFKWYVSEGKRGKLMNSSLAGHPNLSHFLQTGDNLFMSWLHDINASQFYKAHVTLNELASKEVDFVARKKTLLSLSKLAMIASDDPPEDIQQKFDAVNDEHDLILHQEMLPESVFEHLGIDPNNMGVFPPKELIMLYIGDYNDNANELDFKKALDLLQYIDRTDPDNDYEGLILEIWSRAVLRDDWSKFTSEDALAQSKESIFFKTIEEAHFGALNLKEYLPSVEKLLSAPNLQAIKTSHFEFLMKAGYEHIANTLEQQGF